MKSPMLTKTGFLSFLDCPESFWLSVHEPHRLAARTPGAFERMLAADGLEVERQVRKMVEGRGSASSWSFQVVFEADGMHARADVVQDNGDGSIDIVEVKSSSSLIASGRDHRLDSCFQAIVAERAGAVVRRVHVIHVNPDYVREGDIDAAALLSMVDVTDAVREMRDAIAAKIDEAKAMLARQSVGRSGCGCRHRGSIDRRCAGFAWLNPGLPDPSAHALPRISQQRLQKLDAEGRLAMRDLVASDLTEAQRPVWEAYRRGAPVINVESIAAFLSSLEHPLSFYDYETFGSAVPLSQGLSPHAQVPVQFSCHVSEDGVLRHHEHLSTAVGGEAELVAALRRVLPASGSVLVWNAGFEKGRNLLLARLVPEEATFLRDLNARTVDLMLPFRKDYVDARFGGSTSIKKVLPVLAPDLSYPEDGVHDGAGAMEAWREMVTTACPDRREAIRRDLLRYCALDTLAMVRIHTFLSEVVSTESGPRPSCLNHGR